MYLAAVGCVGWGFVEFIVWDGHETVFTRCPDPGTLVVGAWLLLE